MRNYEDSLLERVKNLTSKLAQKQREGCLTEELKLCIRLAQLHGQLDNLKISVQFWQSCMQIATDLESEEENWRAAGEIAKIYCKEGQIDLAESFILENLFDDDLEFDLRLSLIKSEVIMVMGNTLYDQGLAMKSFSAYERALKILDEAFEHAEPNKNVWWWDAVTFRGEILVKLGKFEESRYKEAVDVIKNVQDGAKGNVLISLRTNSILAKIYFELKEYSTALNFATLVITEYGADKVNNELSRTRRQFYCEMLLLAGRCLRFQKDFDFSLENLLLAKAEAEALAMEREIMELIELGTRETIAAKSALNEIAILTRRKNPSSKDFEELADKYNVIGDYEKEAALIEQCRSVATNESVQKRLDNRLLHLYSEKLSNWELVLDLDVSGCKNLILKGRAYEKLGELEEAENCLLEALKQQCTRNFQAQTALFFHYRSRGKLSIARNYGDEALSLETVKMLESIKSEICLIDPNFSYFATRKPSNSLMKMVGSGMVMRTKTKKTKGLQLKRRRGPSKLRISTGPRVRRIEGRDDDSENGLSDFIVDSSSEESEVEQISGSETHFHITDKHNENHNDNNNSVNKGFIVKSKPSLLVISSSDSEATEPERHSIKSKFQFGSPLLIRTESLSDPNFPNPENSPNVPLRIDFDDQKLRKVIVRFKPGVEVIVPVHDVSLSVKELISLTQTRFDNLFPKESKDLGPICGLSLIIGGSGSNSALFPADKLKSVLSKDCEVLQAHFSQKISYSCTTSNNNQLDSPSRQLILEEDFKRKFQILNLKSDAQEEIRALKLFQERFRTAGRSSLNLSGLSLDSSRLSEFCGFINKFIKSSHVTTLCLRENLLCDEDLKYLNLSGIEEVDLSLNFLQKPNLKAFKCVDLSYNPLDSTCLMSCCDLREINLIGCFEGMSNNSVIWRHVWDNLKNLKKLSICLPSDATIQRDFIIHLCENNPNLEELNLFAVKWEGTSSSSCALIELAYLDSLISVDFTANQFDNLPTVESLCKMLKRTSSIKRLCLKEVEFCEGGAEFLKVEGIGHNFTLETVEMDD